MPHYGGGNWGRFPNSHWGWHNHNLNWWGVASAAAVGSWLVGDVGSAPVYYDYGTNLYYEGDNVYYDGDVVATADEYSQQAYDIATNVPEVEPDDVEWLPLGVFALTQKDSDSAEDSTLFLQLAISKEGIIAGTFQNTATGKSVEVEGTIDMKSQRAAWGIVDESWPIMETGYNNLTENEAGALLHFEDGKTQEWTMIRVDEPDEDKEENKEEK